MELPKDPVKFSLIVQIFRGQKVVREGPSRIIWRLFLDMPDNDNPVTAFSLSSNPLENDEVTAYKTPCSDEKALERGKSNEDREYLEPKKGSFWNDSVAFDSIISIKDPEGIHFLPISEIFEKFLHTKVEENGREIVIPKNVEVVGANNKNAEWTKLKSISRHQLNGNLLRLDRSAGFIDVTPNHSIFSTDGQIVDASENPNILQVGFPKLELKDDFSFALNSGFLSVFHDASIKINVMHRGKTGRFLKVVLGSPNKVLKRNVSGQFLKGKHKGYLGSTGLRYSLLMSELGELGLDLFEIFGFYVADGTATERVTKEGRIPSDIRFGSLDKKYLDWIGKTINKLFYQEIHIPVIDTKILKSGKKFYNLRIGSRSLAAFFRYNFGKQDTKQIPPFMLNFPKIYRQRFLQGYLLGDGAQNISHMDFSTISKRLAAGLSALGYTLENYFRVNYIPPGIATFGEKKVNCRESYRFCSSKNALALNTKKYCKIIESSSKYVYDCQTSLDNFVLYPGGFVVHNTKATPSSLKFLDSGNVVFYIIDGFWKFLVKGKHLKGIYTLSRQDKTKMWTWKKSAGPGEKK